MEKTFIEEDRRSSKSTSPKSYLLVLIILAIALFAGGIYFFRTYNKDVTTINAKLHKNEVYLNEDLIYADNTSGASKWVWEFGNGDKSKDRQGAYRFLKSGSYVVRLTVNDNLREEFIVVVRDTIPVMPLDTTVFISGTTHGLVGEEIRLEANGPGEVFEWWFGETKRVDAVGNSALYTYIKPGDYRVQLRSDKNPLMAYHLIRIIDPNIVLTEIIKPGTGAAEAVNDLKKRIQSIADGKDFDLYYNSILSKHLCSNEKVKVQVEMDGQKKQMDIYTYLIGLTFSKGVVINEVNISSVNNEGTASECPTLLVIKQSK